MKKSKAVPATLLIALAASAPSGCASSGDDCVDAMGNVVPDEQCRSYASGVHWIRHVDSGGFGGSGGSGGFFGG